MGTLTRILIAFGLLHVPEQQLSLDALGPVLAPFEAVPSDGRNEYQENDARWLLLNDWQDGVDEALEIIDKRLGISSQRVPRGPRTIDAAS